MSCFYEAVSSMRAVSVYLAHRYIPSTWHTVANKYLLLFHLATLIDIWFPMQALGGGGGSGSGGVAERINRWSEFSSSHGAVILKLEH